jgi:UDP-N-acetylmuramoylalanine--D-glutamate ligase
MTKLYLELANCTTIGVTGSQGKSTTTALIVDILKNAGKKVYVAGNYRDLDSQPLYKIDQFQPSDYLVMEISNRQLAFDMKVSPNIAVITNIHPNHVEEHGSYANYKKAKSSILKYQKKNDLAVLNLDNQVTRQFMKKVKGKLCQISAKKPANKGAYLHNEQIFLNAKPIITTAELPIIGHHNYYNILNALAAISQLKIHPKKIIKSLKKFTGIPHRLQKVATIKGITFIDDMKSTTPTAAIHAINAFPKKPIWLIIGGWHKQVPHDQLARTIKQKVHHLVTLPGTTTNETLVELKNIKAKVPIDQFHDIFSAIEFVRTNAQSGDVVLMSPAGAHFQGKYLENKHSLKSILKK